MAVKTFNVQISGQDTVVEYEDEMSFGQMRKIFRNAVQITAGEGGVKHINVQPDEFAVSVVMAAIIKPEKYKGNVTEFEKLSSKVALKIIKEICKSYPFTDFLEDMAEALGTTPEKK